jgi:transcriptional regulator with XRE-family HTH domain
VGVVADDVDLRSFYRALGTRIKREREQRGWNQERLAADIGVGRTSLTNIEAGRQRVLLHLFLRVAAAFNMNASDLLPTLQPEPVETLADIPKSAREWVAQVLKRRKHGKAKPVGHRAKG